MKPAVSGIYVRFGYAGHGTHGWWARLEWQCGEFCQPGYLEGKVETRYGLPTLAEAGASVLSVPLEWRFPLAENGMGVVYYREDAEDGKPANADELIAAENERFTTSAPATGSAPTH